VKLSRLSRVIRLARRHHVGVDPAAGNRRFPHPVAVIAGNQNRIAALIDPADNAHVSAAAAPSHDGYGADLRSGKTVAIAGERTRHVGAGASMTCVLQDHVHEPRTPQSAAAGWIAADIAPRFSDDVGRAVSGCAGRAGASRSGETGAGAEPIPTQMCNRMAMRRAN
jgi:hypothetical protein